MNLKHTMPKDKDHATEEYIQYDSTYINLKANEIK